MLLGNALSEPDPVARQSHLEATSSGGDRSARKKVRCELYKPVKWLLAGLLIVSDSFRRNPFLRCGGMNPSPTRTDDVWKVGVGQSESRRAACCLLPEGSSVAGRRHAHPPPEMQPKSCTRAETAILRYALHRVLRGFQPALSGQDPLVEHPPQGRGARNLPEAAREGALRHARVVRHLRYREGLAQVCACPR